MSDTKADKQKLLQFGRNLALLFNRATMYQTDHPYIKQSLDHAYQILNPLLKSVSHLVLIMNREQFFIDEEPLDPRINVSRIVSHFKKAAIQSISFEKGLDKNELRAFLEIFSALSKYPDAEAMKKALEAKRVFNLRVNHVFYKKVTADDEVISKDALRKVTPKLMDDSDVKTKKMFMDALLESVLTEEFIKTLNIHTLMKSPGNLSKEMIEADLAGARRVGDQGGDIGPGVDEGGNVASGKGAAGGGHDGLEGGGAPERGAGLGEGASPEGGGIGGVGGGGGTPGPILLHQLEKLDFEVTKTLNEEKEIDTSDLARAVFEMKKQLMEGIQDQKALGIAYENERKIIEKANEISDRVLIKLIRDEYQKGSISISRLAQILRRLVPQADELKRLLPKIKATLIEEGMPISEYLRLVKDLSKELQNEGLAGIFQESAEEIGVDGEGMIEELKRNPKQAAELIYLASEIRKGTGDENALTELLVDYVERLGSKMTLDIVGEDGKRGDEHLEKVMTDVKSKIVRHLENTDLGTHVLSRLEEKLNLRMDAMLDNLRVEWLRTQGNSSAESPVKQLTVLQTLERSVSNNEELGEILKTIRAKVESNQIDENDFRQIHTEIIKQKQAKRAKQEKKGPPAGILTAQSLMLFIEKEIARSKRYHTPFSALAFSVVKASVKEKDAAHAVTQEALMDAVLKKLANMLRETDVLGQLGKNRIVALLPMTPARDAKLALRRVMRAMHLKPLEVKNILLDLKIAGVVKNTDIEETFDTDSFVKTLSTQLVEMAARIKNIQAYF